MRGTTRHICRDQNGTLLKGRRTGPKKLHFPGCRGGTWSYAMRVPTVADAYGYLRRGAFARQVDAEAELSRVVSLMSLAPQGSARQRQIGTAIWEATSRGGPLDEERIRHKVGVDRDPTQPVPTVGRWAEDWLAGRRLRAGTRVAHRRRITNYIIPWLGDIPLDALRNVHVESMLAGIDRRTAGESLDDDPADRRARRSAAGPAMQRKLIDLLRTLIKAAVDANVIDRNPIATFEPPAYEPKERTVWTLEERRTFLQHAEEDELLALFRVASLYGLRRGELLGLRWSDVDLTTGTLHVRQQAGWVNGQPTTGELKTKKSRRSFKIDARTVTALKRQQLRTGRWDLVFADEDGQPLRPYVPLFALKRIAKQAGVPELTLHELRHTAITCMLSTGVRAEIVSKRAGHSTVGFTLTNYAHVLPQDDQAAADTTAASVD